MSPVHCKYVRMYLGQNNVHRGGDVEMVVAKDTVYTACGQGQRLSCSYIGYGLMCHRNDLKIEIPEAC